MQIWRLLAICVLSFLLATAGCMTMQTPAPPPTSTGSSLAHQYGEELLAYMMQVVLGKSGDPDRRNKWASRGVDQVLDFAHIAGVMSDPGGNKTVMMVNDPNILGLSRVLYHYAPEMSQFSGSYATSLYPASELIALRIFILQRLRENQKISIQSLLNHRQLLLDSRQEPANTELAAMNMTLEEVRLLQAVFKSKPWLFNSLTSPFLVDAFSKTGVLANDPLTVKLVRQANYNGLACTPMGNPPGRKSVVVAFLPSMIREFEPGKSGFTPSSAYLAAIERLKSGILSACRDTAAQALAQMSPASEGQFKKRLDQHLQQWVAFQALKTQPLVIYPENAARATREICPKADFVVILLGRNVYQAMHIDPARDAFPAVNRIYLDITDVKHAQISSEITEIGGFIYERIKPWLFTALSARKSS